MPRPKQKRNWHVSWQMLSPFFIVFPLFKKSQDFAICNLSRFDLLTQFYVSIKNLDWDWFDNFPKGWEPFMAQLWPQCVKISYEIYIRYLWSIGWILFFSLIERLEWLVRFDFSHFVYFIILSVIGPHLCQGKNPGISLGPIPIPAYNLHGWKHRMGATINVYFFSGLENFAKSYFWWGQTFFKTYLNDILEVIILQSLSKINIFLNIIAYKL